MTTATTEFLKETLALTADLKGKYQEWYNGFNEALNDYLIGEFTIPDVSKAISDKTITSIGAMRVINDAIYHGMKITTLYQTQYAPKLNELKYDIQSAVFALTNAFNNDPDIQAIKTSAEKERQLQMFAFEVLQNEKEVKKLHDSFAFLGKYVESIIYSLDRMQRMVDSLDRLQGKEMWVDITAQEQAMNIINDSTDLEQFRKPVKAQNKPQADEVITDFERETELIDFDEDDDL